MRFLLAAAFFLGLCPGSMQGQTTRVPALGKEEAFRGPLRAARASGVLLDWSTGKVLAVQGEQRKETPGSLLKPLLLAYALQHGIVETNTRVYCRRSLHVAGRSLPCTHPNDEPMLDAEGALAASCNTWFAALARRMTPQDFGAALSQAGLPHTSEHIEDADARVLTALGLQDVTATPMQIATAYRALLLKEPGTSAVWNGLRSSVGYGMANNARVRGLEVLGKTGTAANRGEWWSHGWFAGAVPGRYVLVVYVPRGDGGVAAALAGTTLRNLMLKDAR